MIREELTQLRLVMSSENWHKATVTEIVEYFNK